MMLAYSDDTYITMQIWFAEIVYICRGLIRTTWYVGRREIDSIDPLSSPSFLRYFLMTWIYILFCMVI